jgi:hypothetical protein
MNYFLYFSSTKWISFCIFFTNELFFVLFSPYFVFGVVRLYNIAHNVFYTYTKNLSEKTKLKAIGGNIILYNSVWAHL